MSVPQLSRSAAALHRAGGVAVGELVAKRGQGAGGGVQGDSRVGGELSGLFMLFTQDFLVHSRGKVLARVDHLIHNTL